MRRIQDRIAFQPGSVNGKQKIFLIAVLVSSLALFFWRLTISHQSRSVEPPVDMRVKVLSVRPHDSGAYTQGLIYYNGFLYESTGLHQRSSLRKTDQSGRILKKIDLPGTLFAEGLERVGNRLVQLTWKDGIAAIYDLDTFQRIRTLEYQGEGWGLCFDGYFLIMSDGTDTLAFRDPETFEVVRKVKVTISGKSLSKLNELEWAEGSIYCNVWPTDRIVRINPQTGVVTAVIHAGGLLDPSLSSRTEVLNGIAYNPPNHSFLLTGKFWPAMFEVVFISNSSKS